MKTLAEEIDETLRHAAGNITPEAKALLEQAKREALEREGLREIPCPDCYGGHFRPCQVSGLPFYESCLPTPRPATKEPRDEHHP